MGAAMQRRCNNDRSSVDWGGTTARHPLKKGNPRPCCCCGAESREAEAKVQSATRCDLVTRVQCGSQDF